MYDFPFNPHKSIVKHDVSHSQVRKLKNRKFKNPPKFASGLSKRTEIISEVGPTRCNLPADFVFKYQNCFQSLEWCILLELNRYPVLWVTNLSSVSQIIFPSALPTPNLRQESSLLTKVTASGLSAHFVFYSASRVHSNAILIIVLCSIVLFIYFVLM